MVAVVVPFKGCQPRGGSQAVTPRQAMPPCHDSAKSLAKSLAKIFTGLSRPPPARRCVSTAAGVMIRLGGAQTRRVAQACSVRWLRCGLRASNRWPLPPEYCAQAKPVSSNQCSPRHGARPAAGQCLPVQHRPVQHNQSRQIRPGRGRIISPFWSLFWHF